MHISGRNKEIKKLDEFYNSDKSEFMAVYGRRRVGKTYLVKQYFKQKECPFFSATGLDNGSFKLQRTAFCSELSRQLYDNLPIETPNSWFKIFELLDTAINKNTKKRFVIFLDELPWMVTRKSLFLEALEYFWNQRWSFSKKVKLIICGSLSSWIVRNVIESTGGLYHRVTYRLKVEPFNLEQTQQFLKEINQTNLTYRQILKLYMVLGGVPLYLEKIKKGKSGDQIIDEICFSSEGLLFDEMKELFKSLFRNSSLYMEIAREIAQHRHGISKHALSKNLKILPGGRLNDRLKELEDAGFIISFLPFHHKEKGTYYRICDEYTMFYFTWIEPDIRAIRKLALASGYWLEKTKEGRFQDWKGYTFETICYKHISQILRALKLNITTIQYTWTYQPKLKEDGAQIDLLFDRPDDAITVCEIKNTDKPFIIDKEYAKRLDVKLNVFRSQTETKKQVFLAFISVSGVQNSKYFKQLVSNVVTLDDFFKN